MNRAESLLLLACLVALAVMWVGWQMHTAPTDPNETPPVELDDLARKWADIAEDFTADEFELLRRIDRQMAPIEAAIWRERAEAHGRAKRARKARPYNWQEGGL